MVEVHVQGAGLRRQSGWVEGDGLCCLCSSNVSCWHECTHSNKQGVYAACESTYMCKIGCNNMPMPPIQSLCSHRWSSSRCGSLPTTSSTFRPFR